MATLAPDVITVTDTAPLIGSGDSQLQSAVIAGSASTPFPVSSEISEISILKTIPRPRPLAPTSGQTRHASAGSTSRSRPQSILICTDPIVEVTPADDAEARETSTESEYLPSCETETQGLGVGGTPRARLTSSSSSSGFEADSPASSTSSTRTRATTLSSTSAAPCVTFAALPEIGPRQRKSSRPIGLAARGQILRQRRMMMAQVQFNCYVDETNSIPGGERVGGRPDDCNGQTQHRSDLDAAEEALTALGKMLGDASKVIWHRVSHAKLKNNDSPKSPRKRPSTKRTFTWPGRLRSASAGSASPTSGRDSDDDSEDEIDGPWTRRRDEDPMTKTIVEGSNDGHGLEQFVLAYDVVPACEEEEEDHAIALADEGIRANVEVHLVKATEGESED